MVGAHQLSDLNNTCVQRIGVKRVVKHPRYVASPPQDDIMLVELAEASRYPVIQPSEGWGETAGTSLAVTGWGVLSADSKEVVIVCSIVL